MSTPRPRLVHASSNSAFQISPQERTTFFLLILAALVAAAVTPVLLAKPVYASSCTANGPHCYGEVVWPNGILGSSTEFQTVHLYSVNDGSDHISEEMWLVDDVDDCNGNGISWVEAGEATWYGHTGNWYFWADCRPGSVFLPHFLYQPPSGDVGHYFQYTIEKALRATNEFSAAMYNTSGTQLWADYSTSNTMAADEIQVGLETTDNSYSVTHSDPDYFIDNQYFGLNEVWAYQANSGSVYATNPPTWTWVIPPKGGNNGGEGKTTCC